ncbi:SURF1 family protein [Asticcacaulis sp. AND118]|uniref:SURF1 family protein n=1 Tax=Asticcacaulis sp. AND118 TaxID=2840468 RepID=UPI001CFFFD3B|nr:SURF1 family protein [Asticcacaulis sp. AND118]UDF05670.1 SURF1 family protein [Asticcacaulis sp. AND118]
MRRLIAFFAVSVVVLALTALGVWQVQRLMWKTALIETVNARVHRAPQPLVAGPGGWPAFTPANDEYRRVTLSGHFRHDKETQVYALTDLGAGYWVMTPLETAGGTVIINRGYVPTELRAPETRAQGQVPGEVQVTGLVRMSQDKGWLFSQPNDPAKDQWFLRDVAQIARARGVSTPNWFIDAEAATVSGGWPRGGLTVVRFTNNHLVYALTWFTLAAGLAGGSLWLVRRGRKAEKK